MQVLQKNGGDRDYSLDFVKGFAAIAVVMLHNLPNYYVCSILWIGQAVPLFLFVSAYLTFGSFNNGKTIKEYFSKFSIYKILNRIFLPFFIITLLQIFIIQIFSRDGGVEIKNVFSMGGIGPGSYYPWLYIQAWFVLPLIIILVKKLSLRQSFILFLSISIALEIISSLVNVNPQLYRLAFYRYLFLLYLSCIVFKYRLKINRTILIFSFITIVR